MKRKISITFLVALITIMMVVSAFAKDVLLISPRPGAGLDYISKVDNAIKLQMDGQYVDFTDASGDVVNPEIINNSTMIPVAKIFDLLECPYVWNGAERKVVATKDNKEMTITIDSEVFKLKDLETGEEKEIILNSVPVIKNSRTLVPARVISESLGKTVGWDNENRTVIIIDFNKVAEDFKEKVPNLQKIFDLEVEPIESFKSISEIEGKITYKDKENKKNNETMNIEGSLKLNMNQEKNMEMYMDLEFSGKGTIYDSIKEAEMENLKIGFIATKDNAYVMTEVAGEEVWTEAGEGMDMSALYSMNMTNVQSGYEGLVELLKQSIGELNISSYAMLEQMIELFANIYSDENFSISGSGSTKTVKMNIDLADILTEALALDSLGLENIKMNVSSVEKVTNKKVDNAKVTFEMEITEPVSKESFELNLELDMKYKNINKDFKIEIPEI